MKKFYQYGLKAGFFVSTISILVTLLLSLITNSLIEEGFSISNRWIEGLLGYTFVILLDFEIIWLFLVSISTLFLLKKKKNVKNLVHILNFIVSYVVLFLFQFIYIIAFSVALLFI